MTALDLTVYRASNQDLAGLSDEELRTHFESGGLSERRPFARTNSATEAMSMRWLRGHGIEIGAGRNPTPLYGDTTCDYADISPDSGFGGQASVFFDLDAPGDSLARGKYDFVIAGHVLEHCDSFIRALANLLGALNENGIGYIILPDKRYLFDQHWLPYYGFDHHVKEYAEPLAFAAEHDTLFVSSITSDPEQNEHADVSADLAQDLKAGRLPADMRFMSHKHNYRFADWLDIIPKALAFLESDFVIEDCAFGRERMDCHFILKNVSQQVR